VDKQEKKRLKQRARAEVKAATEAEWQERMVLDPDQLESLLKFLDKQLPESGCDHTLALTLDWASDRGVEPEALTESLAHFGGGCDCEVLANVDPRTQVGGWPSYLERFDEG
jgi:Protein of unknown function (DUF2695)